MHKAESVVSANFVVFEGSEENNKALSDNSLKVVFPISVGQGYFSKSHMDAMLEPILKYCSHIKFVFSDQNGLLKHKIWGQNPTKAAQQITKAKKKNHSCISNLIKTIQTESRNKKIQTELPELSSDKWEWDIWKERSQHYIKIIRSYYENRRDFIVEVNAVAKNYVENAYDSLSGKNPSKKKAFDAHKEKYIEEAVNNILDELGIMLAWEEEIFKDKFNYIAYPTSESKAYDAIYKLYKYILETLHGQEYKPNLTYLDIRFEKKDLGHQNTAFNSDGSSNSSDDSDEFEGKSANNASRPIDLDTKRRSKVIAQNRHQSAPASLQDTKAEFEHDEVRTPRSQPSSPSKNPHSLFANRSSSISSSISTSTSSSDEEREPVVEHDPFVEGILQKVMTTGLDEKKIQKLAEFASFYKCSLDSKKASTDHSRTAENKAKRISFNK